MVNHPFVIGMLTRTINGMQLIITRIYVIRDVLLKVKLSHYGKCIVPTCSVLLMLYFVFG
jgi:hypothetical protein